MENPPALEKRSNVKERLQRIRWESEESGYNLIEDVVGQTEDTCTLSEQESEFLTGTLLTLSLRREKTGPLDAMTIVTYIKTCQKQSL